MVQKLEAIKGGGGSIKVGTTGTISSLITRELDSIKQTPQPPVSRRHQPQTIPASVASSSATPKRLQRRKSLDEASTSGSNTRRHQPQAIPASDGSSSATPKRLLRRKSLDEASSSGSNTRRHQPQTIPASDGSSSATPKRLLRRKSLDEASTSGSNSFNHKSSQNTQKTKSYAKSAHRIPMLGSENIALDRTPSREKNDKRVSNIVEVVDIKCGNPDRAWASPITNKLKKLGFSKLSESII